MKMLTWMPLLDEGGQFKKNSNDNVWFEFLELQLSASEEK